MSAYRPSQLMNYARLKTLAPLTLTAALAAACQSAPSTPSGTDEARQMARGVVEQARTVSQADFTAKPVLDVEPPTRTDEETEPSPLRATGEFSATITLTRDSLAVDGEELLELDDGMVPRAAFTNRYRHHIRALSPAIEEALLIARRRKLLEGEPIPAPHVLVEVGDGVLNDTVLSVYGTLAQQGIDVVTLRHPDQASAILRSSREHLGARPWRDLRAWRKAPKNVTGDQEGFDAKMKAALSGDGDTLVVGRGAGGMGLRGTGRGGGGQGFGRIGGLGKVDTKKKPKPRPKKKTILGMLGTAGPDAHGVTMEEAFANSKGIETGEPEPKFTPIDKVHPTYVRVRFYRRKIIAKPIDPRNRDASRALPRVVIQNEKGFTHPYGQLHNVLSDFQEMYPHVDKLVIGPDLTADAAELPAITKVNCKLPESSYETQEAYEKALAQMERCEPLFAEPALGRGTAPNLRD